MVAAEAAPADDPGERALDHPSSGLRAKTRGEELLPVHLFALVDEQSSFGNRERLDRLDAPSQGEPGPGEEGAAIVAVSPDQLEAGKQCFEWRQQGSPSLLIGFLGPRHLHGQEIALRINQRVALAAPRFFSPYRSPFPGHARRWF